MPIYEKIWSLVGSWIGRLLCGSWSRHVPCPIVSSEEVPNIPTEDITMRQQSEQPLS